jgi:hypothetical protein
MPRFHFGKELNVERQAIKGCVSWTSRSRHTLGLQGAVVTARTGGRESGGRQQRSSEVSVGGLRVEETGG